MRQVKAQREFVGAIGGPRDNRNRFSQFQYGESPDALLALNFPSLRRGVLGSFCEFLYRRGRAYPMLFEHRLCHTGAIIFDDDLRARLYLEIGAKAFERHLYPGSVSVVGILDYLYQRDALIFDRLVSQHREQTGMRLEMECLAHFAAISTNSSP